MNLQRGKSNITFIVVIVILAAIAAIGVPIWRRQRISDHVDNALKAADAAKVAVMEAATIHGGLNRVKASELGYDPTTSINPFVAHIEISDGGRITVSTIGTGAKPDLQLLLTPEQNGNPHAAISWSCGILVGDAASAPVNCRKVVLATSATAAP